MFLSSGLRALRSVIINSKEPQKIYRLTKRLLMLFEQDILFYLVYHL